MRYQNMELCECDRCGEKEMLSKDAPNQAMWHEHKRVTADGNEHCLLLCDSCHKDYRTLMQTADKTYNQFIDEKKGVVR